MLCHLSLTNGIRLGVGVILSKVGMLNSFVVCIPYQRQHHMNTYRNSSIEVTKHHRKNMINLLKGCAFPILTLNSQEDVLINIFLL